MKIVSIRFKPCSRLYDFDTDGIDLKPGDEVVVETDMGLSIGKVILGPKEIHDSEVRDGSKEGQTFKKVLRKATEEDLQQREKNKELEKEAYEFCLERIRHRNLPMKLICTEATLDRKRILFYFTADGRIDFRELVKDLAAKFRTRIEMRQIGVRDGAKALGGIGVCGLREVCCKTFLVNFAPISIKMAKKQELTLNPGKLSGLCGRLMCCLSYEYEEGMEESEDYMLIEDRE
jgi:cell fate regulator YaaT (PSP1 superfamily)